MDIAKELRDYLSFWENKPFCWGETDCFLLQAYWVHRLTENRYGIDAVQGKYDNPLSAMRTVRSLGGRGFDDLPGLLLPCTEKPCIKVQRGDLVALPQGGEFALGISVGAGQCVFVGEENLVYRSAQDISRAWEINI